MKKFKEFSLLSQAILVYILSLVVSVLISPLFGKLYIKIFNPRLTGGIFPSAADPLALFDGTFFAFYLFLSFFVFWLIKRKQWKVWIIGIALPLLIALSGGGKDFFWAIILSFLGWLLAQIILLITKKSSKN